MPATVRIAFYWGARAVPIRQCSRDVLSFLDHLERCFPKLKSWNAVRPAPHALKRDADSVETELLQGVNHRETDGSPILELGYSFSLVSASKECRWWSLQIHCADYSDAAPNECVIELGTYEPCDLEAVQSIDWTKLLDGIVRIWNPEHGRLTTVSARQKMIVPPFSVGWLTYLSNETFPELPKLPKETPVRELKGLGHFVGALPKSFPAHSEQELRQLNSIHDALSAKVGKPSSRKRKQ